MAVNKVKRSIHLAQTQHHSTNPEQILRPKYGLRISPAGSQPLKTRLHARKAAQPQRPRLNHNSTEFKQVKSHIYRAIADMNGGFELALQGLQALQENNFLHGGSLKGMRNLIGRLRAQANHELMSILSEREKANAGHYLRRSMEQENPPAQRIS
jgi:hypothetical protein